METEYITSKGEVLKIAEMDNRHLVNALVKIAEGTKFISTADVAYKDREEYNKRLLLSLKEEIINRLKLVK